jgi:hypothetical protein
MDNATAATNAVSRLRNLLATDLAPAKRALYEVQLVQLCRRYGVTFDCEVVCNLTWPRIDARTKIYIDHNGHSYAAASLDGRDIGDLRRLDRGEAGRMIADAATNGARVQYPTLIG